VAPETPTATDSLASESTLGPTINNYRCLDLATARQQIEQASLLAVVAYPPEGSYDDSWIVTDQLPAAGTQVPPGSEVDLIVSSPDTPCPG
jgi:beta-lactam-binding protein with PASTA domain